MKKCFFVFLLVTSVSFLAQESFANDQTTSDMQLLTKAQASALGNMQPPDPKNDPDVSFKNNYHSTGPVHTYFSYFVLQDLYSDKLNQLTIVTRDRLTGVNVLAGIGAALGGPIGPQAFATRDSLVGYKIIDISNRKALENPALNDVPMLFDQKISEYVKNTPSLQNRKYYESLTVRPNQWSLVFQDLAEHPDTKFYVLKFQASFFKPIEGDRNSLFHKTEERGAYCKFSSEPKTLEQWKVDDYAALDALRPAILEQCSQSFVELLPKILEEGEAQKTISPEKLVQNAKLMCKSQQIQCVKIAKIENVDAGAAINECKSEFTECRSDEVITLINASPVGQCKIAMKSCKAKIIEDIQPATPGTKFDRSLFNGCVDEFKSCLDEAKKNKNS